MGRVNDHHVTRSGVFVALLLIVRIVAGAQALAARRRHEHDYGDLARRGLRRRRVRPLRRRPRSMAPSPSPRARLAVVGNDLVWKSSDIYVVRSNGTGLTRLAHGSGHSFIRGGASWSPDGSQIAFAANGWKPSALYVVNADSSGLRKVPNAGKAWNPGRWPGVGRSKSAQPGHPVAGSGPFVSRGGPRPARAAGLLAGGGPGNQDVSPEPEPARRRPPIQATKRQTRPVPSTSSLMHSRPRTTERRGTRSVSRGSCRGSRTRSASGRDDATAQIAPHTIAPHAAPRCDAGRGADLLRRPRSAARGSAVRGS